MFDFDPAILTRATTNAGDSTRVAAAAAAPTRTTSLTTGGNPKPLTIREVARRVGRDVKAVHGGVHALIDAGLLERTETNRVAFPFDAIRVEFTLRAA